MEHLAFDGHELAVAQSPEPFSIEAEEIVLGGLLNDPQALERVIEILASEHFYVASHRTIYAAMRALYAQSKPCATVLVMEHLLAQGRLEEVGGSRTLRRLSDMALNTINIDKHAEVIRHKWKRRRVLEVFREGFRQANNPTCDLDEVLSDCATALSQVSALGIESEQPIGDLLLEYFDYLEQASLSGQVPGVQTGFYDLDRLMGGLQQDSLTYVCAAPAMGKTSWILNLMLQAARQGVRCLFFSLEMGRNSLMQRILGSETEIESHRLAKARLSAPEWAKITRVIGELSALGIDISLAQGLKASEIATRTKLWMRKNNVDPAKCLVCLDHMTLVRPESPRDDTRISVGKASGIFRELKNEMHIPMVVLSQLNREIQKRANKRPTLVDMQETARLEQDADMVIGLYRDEYYNPDSNERGIAEAIVLKYRNGPTGTVKLLFEDRFARFLNLAQSGGGV
jgi:replicative DNA helicase